MTLKTYDVSVSNTFDAVSVEDAVMQMVVWLQDHAGSAGYRVEVPDGACILTDYDIASGRADECDIHDHETTTVFIDADDIGDLDLDQLERNARTDLCDACRPVEHLTCSLEHPSCSCCVSTLQQMVVDGS